MVGVQIARGWSATVKGRLRGAASCTHLMEMLMPMATAAFLGIGGLDPGKKRAALKADGSPVKLDTCYAYATGSAAVKMLWPERYRARCEGDSN
jgi:hypothetical protein